MLRAIRWAIVVITGTGVLVYGSAPGTALSSQPPTAPTPATTTATVPSSRAAEAKAGPDFDRDVVPIIESHCLRCHSAAAQKGGLVMDTHEDLMQGGENGPVLTPGNGQASRLIKMVMGEMKPTMPDKGAPLRPEDIATIKAWIDAGAKESTAPPVSLEARIPSVRSEASLLPAVNALAFNPDGRELAVPGYREVRRIAISASGTSPRGSVRGAIDLVRGVAYSQDGKWIAGAGGIPGNVGEVLLWNAATGELQHRLKGHRDSVHDVAFNHRGTRLATCSYDKTVRVWDVETGRPTHVFREHTDAVYAVAFSPDDKWLASGAGDRSVKIWDLVSGTRLYTLSEPTDVVQSVAFQPSGMLLSAAGNDNTIRTWELTARGGTLVRSVRAHNAPVLRIAYSPDGTLLASTASDRTVKIWNAATGAELRTLERQSDWSQALAWSPDSRRLAVGRYDGTVGLYEVSTGRSIITAPARGMNVPLFSRIAPAYEGSKP
jgi:WD40 repeat protein